MSGTKTDKREDFNRLLADCRKGKIDRVLVKSISRFSRNTKDCLAALRELMRLGVTVQFEKENIDTGTLTTELMVSVSGSLAQQESMSISQNIHQSYRRRMERGEFITTKPPYGYRLVNRRDLEIVPEEAEIIRWVFDAYLGGQSAKDIANELIRRGVRDRKGNVHWTTRAHRQCHPKEICSAVRADHQTEAVKSVRQGGNKISSHPAGRFSVVATIPAGRAAFLQTRCAATVTGLHLFPLQKEYNRLSWASCGSLNYLSG